MIKYFRRNWLPFLVFGAIFGILMIDLNPDFTFMNKAADSIGYIYSALYLYPAYHTSAPLFLLIGHFFLMLPVATEAWRFALLSVFATMGTCVFIYFILRKLLKDVKWANLYALLGVFLYGTSAMVISQSIIIETYPLVCLFAVGAYYFALNKKWKLVAVFLGAGCAVHLLGILVLLIFFIGYKEYRKNWKALLITASFALLYLYIPLTSKNAPQMWLPKNTNAVWAVITDTWAVIRMLVGTISIWDIPKRIFDTIGIVGLSIGIMTVIPLVYYIIKVKPYKTVIFWLIVVPIALFISELDMNTFDYTMLAVPFLIILAILGLQIMQRYNWQRYYGWGRVLIVVTILVAIVLAGYNVNYFDIGRTLDPQMATAHLYEVEFKKLPDNAIFMPNWGWEWEGIYLYNKEYGTHIYPVGQDMLNSAPYRAQLEKDGIKVQVSTDENLSVASKEMARSIIELNDNVWTTVMLDPSTFDAEVVPANHDVNLVPLPDEAIIQKNKTNPEWRWIPYNPYDVLTTRIFITQWSYVVFSNKNLLFIVEYGVGGFMLYWIPYRLNERRKKRKEMKIEKERQK